jgi:hypothetical protein
MNASAAALWNRLKKLRQLKYLPEAVDFEVESWAMNGGLPGCCSLEGCHW